MLSLEIHGPQGARLIDLDAPFVAVHGPTNSGKSSLADAIAYCLGQKVVWRLAFRRFVTLCVLRIRIGTSEYHLRRAMGTAGAQIEVLDLGYELLARLPVVVTAKDGGMTFSDWILGELHLKDLIDSDEARALSSRGSRLTFHEVWPYLYRMQGELDRQIILHAGGRDSTRRTLFELLFGLSNPDGRLLKARLKEVKRSASEQERRLAAVESFFAESATTPERAVADHAVAQKELDRLDRTLATLRKQITTWDQCQAELLRRCTQAQQAWVRCQRSAGTRPGATPMPPRTTRATGTWAHACPACEQHVPPERSRPGTCSLCLQPVTTPASAPPPATGGPDQGIDEIERAAAELTAALGELENHQATEPRQERTAIEELTGQRAACKERLTHLASGIAQATLLQELRAGIQTAREEAEQLHDDIDILDRQVHQREEILSEIERRLHEEITQLAPPWFNGVVRLDRKRYLPLVDGQSFAQLGGGVKAAINVAYSLGLLRHTGNSSAWPTHLPKFLIVDAIRKNIGANPSDKQFSSRLYFRAFTSTDFFAHEQTGQVIVLDNDAPPKEDETGAHLVRGVKTVELSHEKPLIPGVSHADTGEDPTV
ncbi:AAA family ATPase [Nocardiopsis protaetiae]|uniref:AAA family ATPase n=1 Tax=Nocardiopsis protaetiae TaxID=3382270 RepID=UPI00387B4EFF